MEKRTKKISQIVIGLAILALLFHEIDLKAVEAALSGLDLVFFGLAALAYLCYNLLMSYRLYYLLVKMGHTVRFRHALSAHLAGMIASDVTPGRAGFFLVPYFLKNRTGCGISDGMAAILAPQGIEFILKVSGGFLGLLFFAVSIDISMAVLVPLCVGGIVFLSAGSVMLWVLWTGESHSYRLLKRIPYLSRFEEDYTNLKYKSLMVRRSVAVILIIYFICWFLLAIQWMLVGYAIGITRLNLLAYFLLHPLITILRFVPLTVSGLGLMEGATALMFSLLGVPQGITIGVVFALLVRFNMILVDGIGLRGVFS